MKGVIYFSYPRTKEQAPTTNNQQPTRNKTGTRTGKETEKAKPAMQNLRNRNILMYFLLSGAKTSCLCGNTNGFKIFDMMETIIIYKGTIDKSVLVKSEY